MIAVITGDFDPQYVETENRDLKEVLDKWEEQKPIHLSGKALTVQAVEFFEDASDIGQSLEVVAHAIHNLTELIIYSDSPSTCRMAFFDLETYMKRMDTLTYVFDKTELRKDEKKEAK